MAVQRTVNQNKNSTVTARQDLLIAKSTFAFLFVDCSAPQTVGNPPGHFTPQFSWDGRDLELFDVSTSRHSAPQKTISQFDRWACDQIASNNQFCLQARTRAALSWKDHDGHTVDTKQKESQFHESLVKASSFCASRECRRLRMDTSAHVSGRRRTEVPWGIGAGSEEEMSCCLRSWRTRCSVKGRHVRTATFVAPRFLRSMALQ